MLRSFGTPLVLFTGLGLSLAMGLAAAGSWETVLRAMNATPFGAADPIFGYEVSFHVFALPLLEAVQSWAFGVVALSLIAAVALYFLALYATDPSLEHALFHFHNQGRAMRTHLLALAALLLLILAAGFWIGMFDVLLTRHDRLAGANFADVHARIPATQALIAATVLTAVLTVVSAFRRDYGLPLAGLVLMAAALVLGRGVLPVVVQKLQVEPAELQQELPYITHSIAYTRQAFGLESSTEHTFPAEESVRPEEVRADPETVANIRLWDPRPLRDTFNQLQSIRPYYVFDDVDVDRYRIDGRVRQVMLSARELVPARLGQSANTWVNRRLQYTHGYGVAMSAVSEISAEGLPSLLVRDLPPVGSVPVRRPELYYGEQTTGYVIVDTGAQEFDFPSGDQNVFNTHGAEVGVQVGPIWRRAALAWFFSDFNLLISSYVTPDSRVLFRRTVRERAQRVVPFAKLDRDPYIAIADGNLYWIVDGYTLTDRYPYAPLVTERLSLAPGSDGVPQGQPLGATGQTGQLAQQPLGPSRRYSFNYIRNSVKVVINAYDGSVRAYLSDPNDPIAQAYARIFPDLFVPLSDMPASLRAHIRYPEDLFRTQADILRSYHVQDPQVFYNGEDVWSLAFEGSSDRRQVVEPYYLIMRLPEETQAEFVLVAPFTPRGRENMTAWLAARIDEPHYGKLQLYKFPRDRLVYGPSQVNTRINQDPTISAQITLWDQQGSEVIRGNLIVIPIGRSTLYVQPLYLQAQQSQLPELKRVVVATGNRLVMEPSLEEGLLRLFGPDAGINVPGVTPPGQSGQPAAPPSGPAARPSAPSGTGPTAAEIAEAARQAREAFGRAQDALRQLEESLRQLEAATSQR